MESSPIIVMLFALAATMFLTGYLIGESGVEDRTEKRIAQLCEQRRFFTIKHAVYVCAKEEN